MFSKKIFFLNVVLLSSISLIANDDEKLSAKDQEKVLQRHVLYDAYSKKDKEQLKKLNNEVNRKLIEDHLVALKVKKDTISQKRKNKLIDSGIYLFGATAMGLASYSLIKKINAMDNNVVKEAVDQLNNNSVENKDKQTAEINNKKTTEITFFMITIIAFHSAVQGIRKMYEGIFYEKILDEKIKRDEQILQILN